MKKIYGIILCIALVCALACFTACTTDIDSVDSSSQSSGGTEVKEYTVTFVDGNGNLIGDELKLKEGEKLTAPDLSEYLETKHLLGYMEKIPVESGEAWDDMIEKLPESVSRDTQFKVVLQDHAFTQTVFDEDGHYTKCNCGKQTEKVDHTLALKSEVQSTCKQAGEKVYECTCGYKKTETLPLAEHTPGDWQSDDEYHWKKCSVCQTETDKNAHTFISEKGETAYETKCSACGKVIKSIEKHAFTTATMFERFTVSSPEQNSVSFSDNKITVNLSTATGLSDTSVLLDKKYAEFILDFKFKYTSTDHTGERYAMVKIGEYAVKYYPYNDQLQVVCGSELLASCYEGALSQHAEIECEIRLSDGKLYVTVDGMALVTAESDCIADNITAAQAIGVYANRVGFEISDFVMFHGTDGVDRVERVIFNSEKLNESTVNVPTYGENAVSLTEDKIKFALSMDTDPESASYDASVKLAYAAKGNFELNFDLAYETGHTQKRFIEITIGGVSFVILPSEEKVFAMRGTFAEPTSWVYQTEQNVAYMSGKIIVKLENGNIYFYHNGTRLAFDGNSDFYFSNIDSSAGLDITFVARRLNVEISNLTITIL